MANANPVSKLYQTVVDDVITNVRDAFLDDGVDEQVLQELKALWDNKLKQTHATESRVEVAQAPSAYTPRIPIASQSAVQRPTVPGHVYAPNAAAGSAIGRVYNPSLGGTSQQQPQTAASQVALPPGMFQQPTGVAAAGGGGTAVRLPTAVTQPQTVTLQTEKGLQQFIIQQPLAAGAQIPATQVVRQIDGTGDSSSEDNDDDDDDGDDDDDDANEDDELKEEDPLNSEDDVSDEDTTELFCTDNVVVCQFDKINRAKNKWKFNLKDGIMNVNGRDLVFHKASGDAEW